MKYILMDLLECPFCRTFPFELVEPESKEVQPLPTPPGEDKPLGCREYCAHRGAALDASAGGCGKCWSTEVQRGLLRCRGCRRRFPIEDGIASILPDQYRGHGQVAGLEDFQQLPPDDCAAPAAQPSFNQSREIEVRDRESSIYDSRYSQERFRAEMETYQRLFQPPPQARVLELGCGTGRITQRVVDRCGLLLAVDFSRQSLLMTRRRINPAPGVGLELLQADAGWLPLRAAVFDQLLSIGMFCNLPAELHQVVRFSLVRALKDGGVLILSAYNYPWIHQLRGLFGATQTGRKQGQRPDGLSYYNFNAQELRGLLEPYFDILELVGTDNRLPLLQQLSDRLSARIDQALTGNRWALRLCARELTVKAIKKGPASASKPLSLSAPS